MMIKKLSLLMPVTFWNFVFIQISQSMEEVKPTSVGHRCKVFESYYLEHPDKEDKSIFKHMNQWHKEDYEALNHSLSQPTNKEMLRDICETLQKSFDKETVSFSKIAASYVLYSLVTSAELDPEHNVEEIDAAIKLGKVYIENGGLPHYNPDISEFRNVNDALGRIIHIENKELRWLPYVSKFGVTPFRTLNNLFGMRAPIIGLPLRKSTYDGYLGAVPHEYVNHEVNHGGFFDVGTTEPCLSIFDRYHKANKIVRRITDSKTQILCDFFLFELGHERLFSVSLKGEFSPFEEACDNTFNSIVGRIQSNCQPIPLDHYWNEISMSSWTFDGRTICVSETHDDYYANTSKLTHFINPENKELFSLIDLINRSGCSKQTVLQEEDIIEPLYPNLLSTLVPLTVAWHEFNKYSRTLALDNYNVLTRLKTFFNKKGFAFEIWEGDKFQADKIADFFRMACETFKKEVGSHFNSLDNGNKFST